MTDAERECEMQRREWFFAGHPTTSTNIWIARVRSGKGQTSFILAANLPFQRHKWKDFQLNSTGTNKSFFIWLGSEYKNLRQSVDSFRKRPTTNFTLLSASSTSNEHESPGIVSCHEKRVGRVVEASGAENCWGCWWGENVFGSQTFESDNRIKRAISTQTKSGTVIREQIPRTVSSTVCSRLIYRHDNRMRNMEMARTAFVKNRSSDSAAIPILNLLEGSISGKVDQMEMQTFEDREFNSPTQICRG